jgi:hypothetical protein
MLSHNLIEKLLLNRMATLYEDADINFEQFEFKHLLQKHLLQKAEGLVGTEMLEMDKLLSNNIKRHSDHHYHSN